ncbi:hypothetical protein EJ08DRAFT_650425 [Tothia fuscella]|uniref:Uncharacterized protein n=1 Tax=Tothia fuscella TaxID=1048955 RepID=A0A9P4TXA6_9PEZI|nr:hypothetical protein EJ08DRAFT_650425 [Tothia fuscella]
MGGVAVAQNVILTVLAIVMGNYLFASPIREASPALQSMHPLDKICQRTPTCQDEEGNL